MECEKERNTHGIGLLCCDDILPDEFDHDEGADGSAHGARGARLLHQLDGLLTALGRVRPLLHLHLETGDALHVLAWGKRKGRDRLRLRLE